MLSTPSIPHRSLKPQDTVIIVSLFELRLEHQKAVAELILLAQYLGALRYAASTGRKKVWIVVDVLMVGGS